MIVLQFALALFAALVLSPQFAISQSPEPAALPAKPAASDAGSDPAASDELSIEQARLSDRYKRLEEVVGRLAELSAGSDPRRAKLLREAIAQSREQDIHVRFESIVKLLQDERLSAAATNQTDLQKELDGLLTLLLKADRDKELSSERERVKAFLKEVGRLIREQKGIRARTQGGDDLKALGSDQKRIESDTGSLGGNISNSGAEKKAAERTNDKPPGEQSPGDAPKKDDQNSSSPPDANKSPAPSPSPSSPGQPSEGQPGQPSESKPSPSQPSQGESGSQSQSGESGEPQPQDPADRATNRLKNAQQQMHEALKKLEDAQRQGATERQLDAIKELEQAKAELERVLRQLREEELERTLTQLAARFRKMLEMQTKVYDGTVRLDQVSQKIRSHDQEIEAARLSRDESQIVHEVEKALSLLREEGSSVAFPETIELLRDDMRQVAERLAAVKVDLITQDLEKDIIEALEETIAALDKSIKDLEEKRTPPGQQPQAGQPGEMPLVDKLAELKMIRSLQMRINIRTERYGRMIEGEQAETPELIKSLHELAERQERVYKATGDLQQERNE